MILLDFHKLGQWYRFRVTRSGSDEYEDFIGIINDLKELVSSSERRYNPDADHLWSVLATEENEDILADLFENGQCCIETVKSELPFDFEEEGI